MPDPELFNWAVGVTVGQARLVLWVPECATAPGALAKAGAMAEAFRRAEGDLVVDDIPLNMGAE